MLTGPDKTRLPVLGVGPIYVGFTILITAVALLLHVAGLIEVADVDRGWLRVSMAIIGGLIATTGLIVWASAVFVTGVVSKIKDGQLVTTGIYAWVRHPIYSGFFLAASGVVVAAGNWLLLIVPPLLWALLTVLMITTEERWMQEKFGDDYRRYCASVNRCVPWPPRSTHRPSRRTDMHH